MYVREDFLLAYGVKREQTLILILCFQRNLKEYKGWLFPPSTWLVAFLSAPVRGAKYYQTEKTIRFYGGEAEKL